MNMKIKILNYKNKVNWIELPENTFEIEVAVISGDEIITAYDEDNNELGTWDSAELCKNPRIIPFHDGTYVFECNNDSITEFNKFDDTYDRLYNYVLIAP